jgi:putative transcriptional regulator
MPEEETPNLRGRLLIAGPSLTDPNFARTVVLMAEYGEEGAMGVVLNRPAESLNVGEAVPELAGLVDPDEPVYVGGPVERNAVIVLAEFDDPDMAGQLILPGIGFAGADTDFGELAGSVGRAKVFAGCAGWAPGQLDAEIGREDWIIADPAPDDLFASDSDVLWGDVLRRLGGNYALIATMPPDPSLN